MEDNKIARLELEISSKSDWTTKALDECFGALTPQDFVNIYELGNSYLDIGMEGDDSFAKIGELTGLDPALEFNLSPTYRTSLLGLYDTIGALIASDREYQALTPDERFKRDQTADAFLEVQQEIRKSPELQQQLRDAVRKMLDDNK
jgi:hypothetical protein